MVLLQADKILFAQGCNSRARAPGAQPVGSTAQMVLGVGDSQA